jgi:DNA-binding response OmpR family regulator
MAIIALSAHAMLSDRTLSQSAGCDAFLSKPIDFELLIATLSAVAWQRNHTADGHDSFRDRLHADVPPMSNRSALAPKT